MVDGRVILSGSLTHYVELPMRISHHTKRCIFLLTKLGHYPMVLGIKWLQIYDVSTKWASNIAIFNSPYCKENYLPKEQTVIMPGMMDVPELFNQNKKELEATKEKKLIKP